MKNIDKLMYYLQLVLKDDVTLDGKVYEANINKIQLSNTFFNTDGCISCGCCCIVEDNVFTQREYDYIMNCTDQQFIDAQLDPEDLHKLKDGIFEEHHTVDGKDVAVYVHKVTPAPFFVPGKGREVNRCSWTRHPDDTHFYCGIHPVTSITCKMPHVRFIKTKNTLSLSMTQYGRNWALGCPIKFDAPKDEKEFNNIKEGRLVKLRLLKQVGEDLNITNTYLPEIIEYVENTTWDNYKSRLTRNIIGPDTSTTTRSTLKLKSKSLF